ncbi:hypothetical protein KWI08_08935 [Morganella morganii]|uniref:hypothetical protein n=1 Tax=Morganella morganii TaxID=582 RepID=UPI0021D0A047|nr:hypothetical protein [Morganella morganii]MCU6274020.1 hypothetical protein [Morganella morganii]
MSNNEDITVFGANWPEVDGVAYIYQGLKKRSLLRPCILQRVFLTGFIIIQRVNAFSLFNLMTMPIFFIR